jgi:moderate conductance mechanosensitive channel
VTFVLFAMWLAALPVLLSPEWWLGKMQQFASRAADSGVALAGILLFYLAARWAGGRLIRAVTRAVTARLPLLSADAHARRLRTLNGLLTSILNYTLLFITLVMALSALGLNITALITSAGIAGLAVGFGAQKLVRDVISGFFVLVEDQYSVGDYITTAGQSGTVETVGMRVTRLRDDQGKQVLIANGDITTVVNHSRGPVLATVDLSVAADAPLEHVRAAVATAGSLLGPAGEFIVRSPHVEGIVAADAAKRTVRVTAEVSPGSLQKVELALREALLAEFAAREIRLV